MIHFTADGVTAEKSHVGHLPRIFPCTLQENYALDRKIIDTF